MENKKHDGILKTKEFRKLPMNELGVLVHSALDWFACGSERFALLERGKKTRLLSLSIKYISLARNKNARLDELYLMANEMANCLDMDNPLELFCTHWGKNKYLGFYHVGNMTFLPLINEKFPFVSTFSQAELADVFDEGIYLRQKQLSLYFSDLQQKISHLKNEESRVVCEDIRSMGKCLTKREYEELKALVLSFERSFMMERKLISYVHDDDLSQIYGLYNAVVTTFLSLTVSKSF